MSDRLRVSRACAANWRAMLRTCSRGAPVRTAHVFYQALLQTFSRYALARVFYLDERPKSLRVSQHRAALVYVQGVSCSRAGRLIISLDAQAIESGRDCACCLDAPRIVFHDALAGWSFRGYIDCRATRQKSSFSLPASAFFQGSRPIASRAFRVGAASPSAPPLVSRAFPATWVSRSSPLMSRSRAFSAASHMRASRCTVATYAWQRAPSHVLRGAFSPAVDVQRNALPESDRSGCQESRRHPCNGVERGAARGSPLGRDHGRERSGVRSVPHSS